MKVNKNFLRNIFFLFFISLVSSCVQKDSDSKRDSSPPYKNPDLDVEKRVDDLLSRMTIEEKIGQMVQFVGINHLKRSERFLSIEELKKVMRVVSILICIRPKFPMRSSLDR